MSNTCGNRLLSFWNEVKLMVCNSRNLVSELEWIRVRSSLNTFYIITDAAILEVLSNMHVEDTDICTDHFLVWMELRRAANTSKRKCVITKWSSDRFGDNEVKLRAEVHGFSEITMEPVHTLIRYDPCTL